MERQVLVDYIPFQVTPQQINESIAKNNGRVVVEGVLQRSGAKNQNHLLLQPYLRLAL